MHADIGLAGSQRRSITAIWLGALLNAPAVFASVIASSADTKGAVACESKLCSGIGIELLKRGVSFCLLWSRAHFLCGERGWADHVITNQGNAADALVGTTLCVGVVGEWIFMFIGQERGVEWD